MHFRSFVAVAAFAALGVFPLTARAQGAGVSPQCSSGVSQDACQKSIDVFQYLAPQLGVVIAGGNATLGAGSSLGGLGHIYIAGRANLVSSDIPQVDKVTPSTNGAQSNQYPTKTQIAGIPQADAAIGIFGGIPLGVTNVGGIDALVSASYLPSINTSGVDLRTRGGSVKFGFGARVGIIQESIIFPGLSATYLHRGLPTVDVHATSGSDSLNIDNLSVSTDSWRLVASKSFFGFGLAAGVGRDNYDSKATASAHVAARNGGIPPVGTPATNAGPITLQQKLSRNTYFLDGSLNFPFVRLIGEIGRAASVKVNTYNTFAGAQPGAATTYGALGLRFGL